MNNNDTFFRFTSGSKSHLSQELDDIAPDIKKYIHNFVFGEIYSRDGLSDEEKILATIISLVSIGSCDNELKTNTNNAINVGVRKEKIVDSLIQILPYVGFPRVINGIKIVKDVFEERK